MLIIIQCKKKQLNFWNSFFSFLCRTIIVQNPFDDPSNANKYHHDSLSDDQISQHPVRFNQELLDNFGITIPITKQSGITELIPLPSPLTNNLGVNIHSINNQPSLTPTIIGTYSNSSYNHHQQPTSNGIYPRSIIQTGPTNGTSPVILHYPPQPYGHQMMKPRMIPPNAYGQVIMPQQNSIIYDPNTIYRTNGQQTHHLSPDNNILKSLLQIVCSEFSFIFDSLFFFIESRSNIKIEYLSTTNTDKCKTKKKT